MQILYEEEHRQKHFAPKLYIQCFPFISSRCTASVANIIVSGTRCLSLADHNFHKQLKR